MIATIDIADLGARSTVSAFRHRPAPADVPGLRWLDVAAAVPLASKRPPSLRRAVLLAMWDDEESAAAFADTHPLAARFGPDRYHAVLRPLRAFGSWPGLPADVSRNRVTHHDGPVIVTTLARLRFSQAIRFFRASRPAERQAVAAPGLIWGTASARPPFLATVSAWADDEAAAAYAFGDADAGHPKAIANQRRKDFHHESAFVRYAVLSDSGTLAGVPTVA
jgi:hypothetical protein